MSWRSGDVLWTLLFAGISVGNCTATNRKICVKKSLVLYLTFLSHTQTCPPLGGNRGKQWMMGGNGIMPKWSLHFSLNTESNAKYGLLVTQALWFLIQPKHNFGITSDTAIHLTLPPSDKRTLWRLWECNVLKSIFYQPFIHKKSLNSLPCQSSS